ncbi:trimeric intracellular cation channel family protein [Bradyrhizobium sp. STM 3809]|uniref:trimeric intracellular cation channel family protein n=1 Tax=Bradyrhizobium sp. STM 3809 TaxID=551936 RepID=UPI000240829C|nr:trimeric intracellular cation channel family protein [Bradyrhizobium sp. STM 3809]CCE03564.1 conserved membrane hypothetical protein [Bradyrhizobium sp. STM 3809]
MLFSILDVVGTFAFALSGATRAVESRMDVFGAIFLAFVASVAGGITRDVIIGATPPAAFLNGAYVVIALIAGVICFYRYGWIVRLSKPVIFFDAIGLGLFCVVGAQKALQAGLSPIFAALLGVFTAIGGGVAADILSQRPPMVLHRDVYALAALAGALVLTLGASVGVPVVIVAPIGAVLATGLRLVALRYDWHLPNAEPAKSLSQDESGA